MEAVDEAADFFVCGCGGAALGGSGKRGFQVAAGAEGVEEDGGDALEIGSRGNAAFLRRGRGVEIAGEFVEGDGDGLAEVHGAMFFTRRNAEEPVAVAEVFVGEAALFGAEQEGDTAGGEACADQGSGLLETLNRVLHFTVADGCGANDEGAVRHGFGEGGKFFSGGEDG